MDRIAPHAEVTAHHPELGAVTGILVARGTGWGDLTRLRLKLPSGVHIWVRRIEVLAFSV